MQPSLGHLPRALLYFSTRQPITNYTRTRNIHTNLTCVRNDLPPHSKYGTIQGTLQFAGEATVYRQATQTRWSPERWMPPHTVGQNVPLSKAIDRTNIKESQSSVPLSPQYVNAHPLDLETPDPLLTPVVTSNIQRLQLPGHETDTRTHIQEHTCARTCACGLEHRNRLQMGGGVT